jgi:hypothetical protein
VNKPASAASAALEVINILTAAGWSEADVLDYLDHPQPGRDRAYEISQMVQHGEVKVSAAAMRAELRRLLFHQ